MKSTEKRIERLEARIRALPEMSPEERKERLAFWTELQESMDQEHFEMLAEAFIACQQEHRQVLDQEVPGERLLFIVSYLSGLRSPVKLPFGIAEIYLEDRKARPGGPCLSCGYRSPVHNNGAVYFSICPICQNA